MLEVRGLPELQAGSEHRGSQEEQDDEKDEDRVEDELSESCGRDADKAYMTQHVTVSAVNRSTAAGGGPRAPLGSLALCVLLGCESQCLGEAALSLNTLIKVIKLLKASFVVCLHHSGAGTLPFLIIAATAAPGSTLTGIAALSWTDTEAEKALISILRQQKVSKGMDTLHNLAFLQEGLLWFLCQS